MALIKCPKCGKEMSDRAAACPQCGTPIEEIKVALQEVSNKNASPSIPTIQQVEKGKRLPTWTGVLIIVGVLLLVGGILFFANKNDDDKVAAVVQNETNQRMEEENQLKNIVESYCQANAKNDFAELERLYATNVERYYGVRNEDRAKVIGRHKKYDKKFGVYGKHSSLRWDSFKYTKDASGYDVVVVEDYSIDRYDPTKPSQFVLEKHFRVNNDFKIVGVWDK